VQRVLDACKNIIKTDPDSYLTGFLEYNPADNRAAFFILHPHFPLISDPSVAPPDIRLNAILRSTAPELDLSQNPFPLLKEEPLNGNPESILKIVQTLKDAKAWSDRLTEALRPKPKKAVSPPSGRPPGGWFS
ncbi:MAG: hypothetical protein ACK5T0_05305, partial [Vampirovibrionales bacterium]